MGNATIRKNCSAICCKSCNHSQNGKCWAILCCFCGSWLLSLFVLCLDGFKVYRHFCPACNVFIGEYSPKMSGGVIALLVFLTILFVGLQAFVVFVYLNRSY